MNILSADDCAVLESCGKIKTWGHIGVMACCGMGLMNGSPACFWPVPCVSYYPRHVANS